MPYTHTQLEHERREQKERDDDKRKHCKHNHLGFVSLQCKILSFVYVRRCDNCIVFGDGVAFDFKSFHSM